MKNKLIPLLVITWFVLNCVNASFTELSSDEAYYWVYSNHLDWGYFDHPPMIALIIKLGYALLPNELGARLISIAMSTGTLCLILKMIPENRRLLGFLSFASLLAMHVLGFTCVPDLPLIFFTALFFFVYEKYLKQESYVLATFLGLIVAALLYSKYNSIVVIIGTVLTNLKLFKKPSFYLIVIISALIFLPHVLWQFTHSFPSAEYHFVSRSRAYDMEYTGEYFVDLLIFYGPLTGLLLFYLAFRKKAEDKFEQTLKVNMIATLAFTFLLTFKGRVEINWLVILVPSLIILAMRYSISPKQIVWLKGLGYVSCFLFLIFRLHTITPLLDLKKDRAAEFRGWKEFTKGIMTYADGKPIVATTYQLASKMSFYSGSYTPSISLSGRHSQYDFWKKENEQFINTDVVMLHKDKYHDTIVKTPTKHSISVSVMDSIPIMGYAKVSITQPEYKAGPNQNINVKICFETDYAHKIPQNYPTQIFVDITQGNKHLRKKRKDVNSFVSNKSTEVEIAIQTPDTPGEYEVFPYLISKDLGFWRKGRAVKLIVEAN